MKTKERVPGMVFTSDSTDSMFGQIKACIGFTSFMLRGLFKINGEFKLLAIAHNLCKIFQLVRKIGMTIYCMSGLTNAFHS